MNKLTVPGIPPYVDLGISNFMNGSVTLYKQVTGNFDELKQYMTKQTNLSEAQNNTNNDILERLNQIEEDILMFKERYRLKVDIDHEDRLVNHEERIVALEVLAHPPCPPPAAG